MNAQLAQLARELVSVDSEQAASDATTENFDQISFTIKTILQSGKEEAFTEHLNQFIQRKEQEIEKMCNFHYQEFIQSVDQLLKVRQGTVSLKAKISQLNGEMQATGQKIIEKKKEAIEQRRMLLNVEIAMEATQTCILVLDIANKINNQIASRKYYSALRLLQDLESVHLAKVKEFSFGEALENSIPLQREAIRQAVTKEVREWFVTVQGAMRKPATHAINESRESLSVEKSLEILLAEGGSDFDRANVRIDFKPLYQCLHIYDILGFKNDLKVEYEQNRQMQASLVFKSDFNLTESELQIFQNFLADILGFFIIEAVVLNSTHDFRSRTTVEILWECAVDRISHVITNSLAECENPDLYLTIKLDVLNFIIAIEHYKYHVEKLKALMLSLFDRYTELMKSRCSERVIEIIEEDEYTPMIVVKALKYKEETRTSVKFPRTLPFSKAIPSCCEQIRFFVNGFYRFADGFEQNHNEMDDLLKKSLENLLIQSLATTLSRKLSSSNMSQAVQIMINLDYFEQACHEFEELLIEKRSSQRGRITLQATNSFKDMKLSAEKRIFELVKAKIKEFLEISNYDWTPTHRRVNPNLLDYLMSMVNSTLATLPSSTKNFLFFDSFNTLANDLIDVIINKSGKKISMLFMENLEVDITFLEDFAKNQGDVDIGDAFLELKQTIALIRSDNYEDYLNSGLRGKKYSRIRPGNLALILEKLKQGETPPSGLAFHLTKAISPTSPHGAEGNRNSIRNINSLLPALKKLLK
ncbi:exocyst complex subunit Sec15-like-domain-containing protein [Zopfochytrium polystomum]|nr:exocyst complex subunit Sec15-like-domain-containing protein [Zopfochytrium polystomum]